MYLFYIKFNLININKRISIKLTITREMEMSHKQIKTSLLKVLHFNDAYDLQARKNSNTFTNFYYLVKTHRTYESSLLLFSGDTLSGSKLSTLLHGRQMIDAFNVLEVDAACYGNHDFDYGVNHLSDLNRMSNFPWLLGNIHLYSNLQSTNLANSLDYVIKVINNIKIGIIGVVGSDFLRLIIKKIPLQKPISINYKPYFYNKYSKQASIEYQYLNEVSTYCYLIYENYLEYCNGQCKKLRQEGCDLIIALTHMHNEEDFNIAKSTDVDLILGGHDHCILHEARNGIVIKSGEDFEGVTVIYIFYNTPMLYQIQHPYTHCFVNKHFYFEVKFHRSIEREHYIDSPAAMYMRWIECTIKSHYYNKTVKNNRPHTKLVLPTDTVLFRHRHFKGKIMLEGSIQGVTNWVARRKGYIPCVNYSCDVDISVGIFHVISYIVYQYYSCLIDETVPAVLVSNYHILVDYLCDLSQLVYLPMQFSFVNSSKEHLYYSLKALKEQEISFVLQNKQVCWKEIVNICLTSLPIAYKKFIYKCCPQKYIITFDRNEIRKLRFISLLENDCFDVMKKIALEFMRINNIEPMGLVINYKPIRSCLYETYLGYLPSLPCKIIPQNSLLWVNLFEEYKQYNKDSHFLHYWTANLEKTHKKKKLSSITIIRTKNDGFKLAAHISTLFQSFNEMKYLDFKTMINLLSN